jgi:hypothetical protein
MELSLKRKSRNKLTRGMKMVRGSWMAVEAS